MNQEYMKKVDLDESRILESLAKLSNILGWTVIEQVNYK